MATLADDFAVLKNLAFRRLFFSRTAALLGVGIAPVALTFAILGEFNGSAGALSAVLLASTATRVLFLLWGGVLADRLPRRPLMIAAEVTAGVAQVGLGLSFLIGPTQLWALIALAAVQGASSAMFIPASSGVVPQILPPDAIQPANALLRSSANTTAIIGVAIAGVTVTFLGAGWALLLTASTFFASAGFLSGMHLPAQASRTEKANLLREVRDGWVAVYTRPWILASIVQFSIANALIAGAVRVLGPLVALENYGGASGWSVVLIVESVGYLVGSALAIRIRPKHPMLAGTLFTFGFAPVFFLLAVEAPLYAIALALFLNGLAADVFQVLWNTALHVHVPKDLISRVYSYDSLGSYVLAPVGLAVAAPLAAAIGLAATLYLGGALMLACTACALVVPSLRNLESQPRVPGRP